MMLKINATANEKDIFKAPNKKDFSMVSGHKKLTRLSVCKKSFTKAFT